MQIAISQDGPHGYVFNKTSGAQICGDSDMTISLTETMLTQYKLNWCQCHQQWYSIETQKLLEVEHIPWSFLLYL